MTDDFDISAFWTDDIPHLVENVRANMGGFTRSYIYKPGGQEEAPPPASEGNRTIAFVLDEDGGGPAAFSRPVRAWLKRKPELVLLVNLPANVGAMIGLAAAVRDARFDAAAILIVPARRKAWLAALSGANTRLIGFADVLNASSALH